MDYAILLTAVLAPFASLFYKSGNVEDPVATIVTKYECAKENLDKLINEGNDSKCELKFVILKNNLLM